MVRFARRNQSDPKRKHESTKWEEMFDGQQQQQQPSTSSNANRQSNYKNQSSNFNNGKNKWNNNGNKKFSKETNGRRFDLGVNKFSRLVDKEVMDDLKKLKNQSMLQNF